MLVIKLLYLFSKPTFYTQLYDAGAGIQRTTLCFDGCFLKVLPVRGPRRGLQGWRRNKGCAPSWACLGVLLVFFMFLWVALFCYTHQCHLSTTSYLAAAASSRSSWFRFPVYFLFPRRSLIKLPEISVPHRRPLSPPQKSELQLHTRSLRIQ